MTAGDLPDVDTLASLIAARLRSEYGFGYRGAAHSARVDAQHALDAIATWRKQQPKVAAS